MLISRDLDCTNTVYIQFSFKFIAKGKITVDLLSLVQLYSYLAASQERIWIYIFNFSAYDHQFSVSVGICLRFCIIPTLLPTYVALCAVPKKRVSCANVKTSTASTAGLSRRQAKELEIFLEIL